MWIWGGGMRWFAIGQFAFTAVLIKFIVGTGSKFATGINDMPVSLIPLANFPPVHLTPAENLLRCRWHHWQICHQFWLYWWCTLTCEYLLEFLEKFEMTLMLFSGTWGKMIHEKSLRQKIVLHSPIQKPFHYLKKRNIENARCKWCRESYRSPDYLTVYWDGGNHLNANKKTPAKYKKVLRFCYMDTIHNKLMKNKWWKL